MNPPLQMLMLRRTPALAHPLRQRKHPRTLPVQQLQQQPPGTSVLLLGWALPVSIAATAL